VGNFDSEPVCKESLKYILQQAFCATFNFS